MPEGPEVHLAAAFVKEIGKKISFSGKVEKSAVSNKNPDIPWDVPLYTITATARGKEMRVTLTEDNIKSQKKSNGRQMNILFRFGMSGKFEITERGNSHKHSHLKFFTSDGRQTLSFVDMRRFGRWLVSDDWSSDRGPCILTESNLLPTHLSQYMDTPRLKNRPICEALLDQRLFNGVGNYLRAEILHRCAIPPFEPADEVLDALQNGGYPPILQLVEKVPQEVMDMNLKSNTRVTYMNDADASSGPEMDAFFAWLRCYGREGMKTINDSHKRTVWFSGPAGRLVPKDTRSKRQPATLKKKIKASTANANDNKADIKCEPEEVTANGSAPDEEIDLKSVVSKNRTTSKRKIKKEKEENLNKAKEQKIKDEKILIKTEPSTPAAEDFQMRRTRRTKVEK